MGRAALKIVERAPFYSKEVELWSNENKRDAHSLHYAVSLPLSFNPELPAHFIERFSEKGDVVLDPFCGTGTTALEANLRGRVSIASDLNPLAMRIVDAKLNPADIAEVTLHLQMINLRRPVNLDSYSEYFSSYYDIDTFREISNLRRHFSESNDRIAAFVELVALGLLHGHSSGYFSTYALPHVSLSPSEQMEVNLRRNQTPDYRPVVPRILRRAAGVLRDGAPSVLRRMSERNIVGIQDSRDLSQVSSGCVDLTVTAPPLPSEGGLTGTGVTSLSEIWLKLWFSRIKRERVEGSLPALSTLECWLDFMNESLFELARVTRSGGRAVLDLRRVTLSDREVLLDQELVNLIEEKLSRFWEAEALYVNKERSPRLKNQLKERDRSRLSRQSRLLVLRRR